MKQNISALLSILFFVSILFTGCEEEDDYNYNSIVPIISEITGPSTTAASGLAPVEYSILPRGGSTTAWTVIGHEATVSAVEGKPYAASILYAQSDVDVAGVLVTVVETTQGGVASEADTIVVSLTKFKPMAFSEFLGDWSCVEVDDGDTVAEFDVTLTAGTDENTLVFAADAGIPTIYNGLFESIWGETFQAGFGSDGDIIVTLNLNSGAVSIGNQYFGQTLPGPYDYWINGSGGTWEGFNVTMEVHYALQFDDTYSDDYRPTITYMTKL